MPVTSARQVFTQQIKDRHPLTPVLVRYGMSVHLAYEVSMGGSDGEFSYGVTFVRRYPRKAEEDYLSILHLNMSSKSIEHINTYVNLLKEYQSYKQHMAHQVMEFDVHVPSLPGELILAHSRQSNDYCVCCYWEKENTVVVSSPYTPIHVRNLTPEQFAVEFWSWRYLSQEETDVCKKAHVDINNVRGME